MAKLTSIHWENARALRADVAPFKVAALQPVGELTICDELGPRHGDHDLQRALERSQRFIELANSSGADLVLAPEYSIPPVFVSDLLASDDGKIREGAVYILPMGSTELDFYDAFVEQNSATVRVTLGEVLREDGRASVNACAILTRSDSMIHALFQAKVVPAGLEETAMAAGDEVFAIEGPHMCLSVATCADLNLTGNHTLWCKALERKSGGILFHPQWNPAADFQAYETFWRASLGHEDGKKRMVFALNWARDSRIIGADSPVHIDRGRSRILRGRTLPATASLRRDLSLAGMNAHEWAPGGGSTNRFEVWHAADGGDTVWIWEFLRPFTSQTGPTVPRHAGLRSASIQRWDRNGSIDPKQLVSEQTEAFWAAMATKDVSVDDCAELEDASPFDVDRFCSACRMRPKDEWLEVDPTERPSSPLDCTQLECAGCPHNLRQCSRGRVARYEAIGYTADSIRVFTDVSTAPSTTLRIAKVLSYPLNLVDPNGEAAGWLIHGRGRSARDIEKDATILLGVRLQNANRPIELFAFQVDGDVDPARIGQKGIDREDPGPQDIMDPEHGREVVVTRLERGLSSD